MTELEFGYLPILFHEFANDISIQNIAGSIHPIKDGEQTYLLHDSWAYPPRHYRHDIVTGELLELPYRQRVFELPKTHNIISSVPNDEDRLKFVVWVIGFVLGIRLTTEDAGFVDSTPLRIGSLIDGVVHHSQHHKILEMVIDFYAINRCQPQVIALCIGAIHAHFLSSNRNSFFHEEFSNLYAALDALAELTRLKTNSNRFRHGERINWLCSAYSIVTPSWAVPDASGNTEISSLRNENFHEALFAGEPLGFIVPGNDSAAHIDPYLNQQIRKLVSRILVAVIFGPQVGFVQTQMDSRIPQPLQF